MKILEHYKNFIVCYRYLKNKECFFFALLCKLFMTYISFLTARIVSTVISVLGGSFHFDTLFRKIISLCVFFAVELLLDYISFFMTQKYEKETRIHVKSVAVEKIVAGNVKISNKMSFAKLQVIVMTDCIGIVSYISLTQDILIQSIYVIISFAIMLRISVLFTTIVILIILAYAMMSIKAATCVRTISLELASASDEHFSIVKSIVVGMKTIRTMQVGDLVKEKYRKNIEKAKKLAVKNENVSYIFGVEGKVLKKIWIIGGLLFIAYYVGNYDTDASQLIFFFLIGRMFCDSLISVIQKEIVIRRQYVSVERFLSVMEANKEVREVVDFPNNLNVVSVSELHFSYEDNPVLSNISFCIYKGLTLVTGKNGAGKTTLLNILGKCIDTYSGSVQYGGISIEEINEESFFKNVACYFQNDMIFNDWSILENIMCKYDYTDYEIERMKFICEKVGFSYDISTLEHGFETTISDIRDFSYGQRKKILLARTLLKEANVFIFDEPLEGIDEGSKKSIASYLAEISKEKIVIISTHKKEYFSKISCEIKL